MCWVSRTGKDMTIVGGVEWSTDGAVGWGVSQSTWIEATALQRSRPLRWGLWSFTAQAAAASSLANPTGASTACQKHRLHILLWERACPRCRRRLNRPYRWQASSHRGQYSLSESRGLLWGPVQPVKKHRPPPRPVQPARSVGCIPSCGSGLARDAGDAGGQAGEMQGSEPDRIPVRIIAHSPGQPGPDRIHDDITRNGLEVFFTA